MTSHAPTLAAVVDSLARSGALVRAVFNGLDPEAARWRPAPGKWSLLEVLNHLADEERDDFRRRVEYTLQRPGEPWPPIDPEGWCRDRRYNERDPDASLEDFLAERARSLDWLRGLGDPDLEAAYEHPHLGRMRAGDLLAAWTAHDHAHLRQIAGIHLARARAVFHPFSTAYADP